MNAGGAGRQTGGCRISAFPVCHTTPQKVKMVVFSLPVRKRFPNPSHLNLVRIEKLIFLGGNHGDETVNISNEVSGGP